MDNQNSNTRGGLLFSGLILVSVIFVAFLTVLTAVYINNKIKEGRYIGKKVGTKNVITVSGKGTIYTKPDLATVTFSVNSEAKEVSVALEDNSKKMNAVISFLKEQGIGEKDLKTTSFNIYPRYEYRKAEPEIYPYPPGKRVLAGFDVRQSLQVKIRDLSKVGEILDGATKRGANIVGNLGFTIENLEKYKEEAREEAIKQAKEKAKKIASQLGVHLERIVDFSESSFLPRYSYSVGDKAVTGRGEIPEIEPGQNKIEVSVAITYGIN